MSDSAFGELLHTLPVSYACFQHETGEGGTPHFQGYLELLTQSRITGLKKFPSMATVHWEKRQGTRSQARDYCSKSETATAGHDFFETCDFPQKAQGSRTDLIAVHKLIKEGIFSF